MESSGIPPVRTPEILLGRYRSDGRPEDLAALFDATSPELFRLALHLCPDAATAEDVLQETFLVVLERASAWDPSRPAMPWLTGILKNEALMARRRAARRPDPRRLDGPVVSDDPVLAAADAEEKARLEKAMQGLPEPYRGVALLRWRYGLEPSAIADVKGVPPGTVWSWLHRAVRKLKVEMGAMPALLLAFRPERGLDTVRSAVLRRAAAKAIATGAAAGATASIASFTLRGLFMSTKGLATAAVVLVLAWTGWFMFRPAENPSPAAYRGIAEAGPSPRRPVPGPLPRTGEKGKPGEESSTSVVAPSSAGNPVSPGPVLPDTKTTLRVYVNTESGAAVEGVTVLLSPPEGRAINKFTNSLGFALYRGLEPVTHKLQVSSYSTEMDGFAPPWPMKVVPAGQTIRLVLREAAEVRGTLVDAAGNPLPRMSIEVYCEVDRNPVAPIWEGQEPFALFSDDHGEFLLKKAPRGVPLTFRLMGIRFPPRDPDDPGKVLMGEEANLRGEVKGVVAPANGVRIVASDYVRDRSLEVIVLDADGRRVPLARIRLSHSLLEMRTGADGSARFKNLGADPMTVMVMAEGFPAMAEDAVPPSSVEVKPAGQTVTLNYTHGTILRGRVLLPDGSPAAGADVRCSRFGEAGEGIFNSIPVRTDAEGRFRAAVPPERKVNVTVGVDDADGFTLSSFIQNVDPANGEFETRVKPLLR